MIVQYTAKQVWEIMNNEMSNKSPIYKHWQNAAKEFVKKGIGEITEDEFLIRYGFTGPQTYQNACLKAKKQKNNENNY